MKTKHIAYIAMGCAAAFAVTSCEKEGPAEKAGEKMDNAAEKAGDKVEDATDNAKDKVEDAGDAIEDATDN